MKQIFALIITCLSFANVVFGGNYVEFKFTGSKSMQGTMKAWYQDGNSRSEMEMAVTRSAGLANIAILSLGKEPGKSYMLNETDKTYTEMKESEKTDATHSMDNYDVVLIGKETVNGYACTHLKLQKKGEGQLPMHFWVSKGVQGYAELKKLKGKYMAEESMYKAMVAKGFDGYPVRMKIAADKGEIQMDLIKSEVMDIPASKFSLQGYEKAEAPALPGGLDMEKIKNMSPAERQKMMEDMMKQYGK